MKTQTSTLILKYIPIHQCDIEVTTVNHKLKTNRYFKSILRMFPRRLNLCIIISYFIYYDDYGSILKHDKYLSIAFGKNMFSNSGTLNYFAFDLQLK